MASNPNALYFVGVRPDYVIEVRSDLLKEVDGPTLAGIQSLEGKRIDVPPAVSQRPDRAVLEARYKLFQSAERP